MRNMKHLKSNLSTLSLLFSLSLPCLSCGEAKTVDIHLPEKNESSLSSTGMETKWSRVSFGSYPSKEIVASDWDGIDGYALREGDVVKDDKLYSALSSSNWVEDYISHGGKRYYREKEGDLDKREQHYRYDGSEYHYFEVEPLKWRVIGMEGKKMTLLSDRTIDCLPFHELDESVNWSSSSVRNWLNDGKNGFLSRAFGEKERDVLLKSVNENKPNPSFGTSSGSTTEDYVYLLSNEEVFASEQADKYGFYAGSGYDDCAKRFTSTAYAKYHGCWWSPVAPYKGNSFWFMRTSGYTSTNVTYICDFGYIYGMGTTVMCDDAGILPVINIDSTKWKFDQADEVSSLSIIKTDTGEEKENTCRTDEIDKDKEVVSFGRYPQDEVVKEGFKCECEGIIVDKELFNVLKSSNWDDKVIIDGSEYEKIGDRYFKVQPIKWKVLTVKDGKSLLFPVKSLDCVPYNQSLEDSVWSECTLREWLNNDFLSKAFAEEIDKICEVKIDNERNFYFNTSCGEESNDKVFLLSEKEVFSSSLASDYGFSCSDAIADENRQIKPTRYAEARGVWSSPSNGGAIWMLRTNGYNASNAVYVDDCGYIYNRGMPVTCKDAGLMPALWARL